MTPKTAPLRAFSRYNECTYKRGEAVLVTPFPVTPKELASMRFQRITPPFPDPNPSGICQCGCGQPVALIRHTRVSEGRYAGHHSRFIQSHIRRRHWVDQIIDTPERDDILIPVRDQNGFDLFSAIDRDDLPLVVDMAWHANHVRGNVYAEAVLPRIGGKAPHVLLHRVILGLGSDDPDVDHINGDGLDNRRSNLRLCTNSLNQANRHRLIKGATSKYRGVCWDKAWGKWRAGIGVSGKSVLLGSFANEVDAARAYDNAARELFGEFARLNFPLTEEEAA